MVQTLRNTGAWASYVRKAQGLARQGMDTSHAYGTSAVGASPTTTSVQKSKLPTATGVLHKGSSRTLAIEWIYGPDGQPEVRNPQLVIRAWLRFYDEAEVPVAAPEKAWPLRYAEITGQIERGPSHVWDAISSAMSASILHLIQLHVIPVFATKWFRRQEEGDSTSDLIAMDMHIPIDRGEHLIWIENRLAQEVWGHVSSHEANS